MSDPLPAPARWLARPGLLLVGLLAIAGGTLLLESASVPLGLLLWALGLGLAVVACAGTRAAGAPCDRPVGRAEALALGSLVVTGLVVRLWQPEAFPNGVQIDEGAMGLVALDVLEGRGPHPFGFGFIGDPGLFFYAEAAFMALLGPGVGPGVVGPIGAVRTMAGLAGALTLPALWLFARPLFGPRVALVAVGLLAFSAAHLHFSRIAVNFAGVPLLGVLGLGLAWRGIREGRPRWHLLAGMAAGFAQYVHFGARAWIVGLAGAYAVLLLAHRRSWRAVIGGGLLAALGIALVLLPQLAHVRDDPKQLWDRFQFRSVFRRWDQATEIHQTTDPVWVMVGQFKVSLLAFVNMTDRSPFYGFTQEPLLYGPVAALFLLGLVIGVLRLRDPRYATILLSCAGVLAAGALSAGVPQFHRLMPMLPAACLLAAVAASWIVDRITSLAGRSSPHRADLARAALLGLLVAATAFDGLHALFVRHPAGEPWQPHTAWARWAASQDPGQILLLAAATGGRENALMSDDVHATDERVRLLARGRTVRDVPNPTLDLPAALAEGRPLVVALSPRLDGWLPLFRHQLPDAVVETVPGPDDQPLLLQFRVPAGPARPAEPAGLRGELTIDERAGTAVRSRQDAALAFREAARLSDGRPYRARWTGELLVEDGGEHRLELFTDGAAELLLDGKAIVEGRSAPDARSLRADLRLTPGPHGLEVRYAYTRGPGILELRWRPPNAQRTLIPPTALRPR